MKGGAGLSETEKSFNTMHLNALAAGGAGRSAFDAVFAAVLGDLRATAGRLLRSERCDHTLQPTALVNEAYLRLFDVDRLPLESRTHFLNIASRAMRRILVEHARRRDSVKRGGGWRRLCLTELGVSVFQDDVDVLDLHEALANLARHDERAAGVVEMRVFGGMTMDAIAQSMGLTRRTIQKDWRFATMWLRREFAGREGGPPT